MKKFRNFLRQPRYFLSVFILPLLFQQSQCPVTFPPLPPPSINCPNTISLTIEARKCLIIEPPCSGTFNWQAGDSISITSSREGDLPLDSYNRLGLTIEEIRSGNSLMRRLCSPINFSGNILNGRAKYEYTSQNGVGTGTYYINFNNQPTFSAYLDLVDNSNYGFANWSGLVLQGSAVYGVPPYFYAFTANGVSLPPGETNPLYVRIHYPTRNTEYRVTVFGSAPDSQATDAKVVFVPGNPDDPTAAFTLSSQTVQIGEYVQITASESTGNITRLDWDFDWHGEILEPFEFTTHSTGGITAAAWNQAGRKYIRLRVSTPSGNFHEIFQKINVVGNLPSKTEFIN